MVQVSHYSLKFLQILTLALGFFNLNLTMAQNTVFAPPIKLPMFLSGNFCELRGDHFHAGIDIKTLGVIGHPVHSIADGFISRIKVSPYGYGHVIYIQHNNGYTSVYGHLSRFNKTIEAYIKSLQYSKHSFAVDKYLKNGEITVKKDEVIAFSGNSGSSEGPHLHFEIRKTTGQLPVNPLKFNFPVVDTIPPQFRNLFVYEIQHIQYVQPFSKRMYFIQNQPETSKTTRYYHVNSPIIGFGAEVYDFLNGSLNKCGVFAIEMFVNDTIQYQFKFNEMPFDKSLYINSHMDYEERNRRRRNVHKLFRDPNNQLPVYTPGLTGLINLLPNDTSKVLIVATDVYNNKSFIKFGIIYTPNEQKQQLAPVPGILFKWDQENYLSDNLISFTLPTQSLYADCNITYARKQPADSTYFSYIFQIGDEFVPIHNKALLKLHINRTIDIARANKLVVVKISDNGKIKSYGGTYKNNTITAKVGTFGTYTVMIDTTPPGIIPISYKKGKKYNKNDTISFRISDDLSGIKTYNGYIGSKWCLFEYDAKNNLLFYKIDDNRLKQGQEHHLKVFVMDGRNNINVFEGSFNY